MELPGSDHFPWVGNTNAVLDEIEGFLASERQRPEPDRVLATVMFTNIVGAAEKAAMLGDRPRRDLLNQHHAVVRGQLARFRGREIDTAGDGFLASFDGPARGVRTSSAALRYERAPVSPPWAGQTRFSSRAPKDLVAGSGIAFQGRGVDVLGAVPGEWHLYAVASA